MTGAEIAILLAAVAWISRAAAVQGSRAVAITNPDRVISCANPGACASAFYDAGPAVASDTEDQGGEDATEDPYQEVQVSVNEAQEGETGGNTPPPKRQATNVSNGGSAYVPTGDVDMDLYRY